MALKEEIEEFKKSNQPQDCIGKLKKACHRVWGKIKKIKERKRKNNK